MRLLLSTLVLSVQLTGIVSAHDLRGRFEEFEQLSEVERAGIRQSEEDREILADELRINPDAGSLETVLAYAALWKPGATIGICFFDGTQSARSNVAAVAREWIQHAHLSFDFGSPGTFANCGAAQPAQIRITFRTDGYWSYVGSDSLHVREDRPTMGLRDLDRLSADSPEFRTIVLHEFGHAIGLEHEHQSSRSDCESEFNWDYLTENLGMSKQELERNMERFRDSRAYPSSEYDPDSIMHYSLPAEYFENPETAQCFTEPVSTLSQQDKAGIAEAYPVQAVNQRSAAKAPIDSARLDRDVQDAIDRISSRKEAISRED